MPLTVDDFKKEENKVTDSRSHLYHRLVTGRAPLLLVGEGNFSFSVALAALRDGWEGIISTTLEKETPSVAEAIHYMFKRENNSKPIHSTLIGCEPAQQKDTAQKINTILALPLNNYNRHEAVNDNPYCSKYDEINGWLKADNFSALEFIQQVKISLEPLRRGAEWYSNVDATGKVENKTFANSFEPLDNVWFQCPWKLNGDVSSLIKDFMCHFAERQTIGQYLLIGITTHGYYFDRYYWNNLLVQNEDQNDITACDGNYKYLGFDDELITKILDYGYKHHSDSGKDIHDLIRDYHKTMIFVRTSKAAVSQQSSTESAEGEKVTDEMKELKL